MGRITMSKILLGYGNRMVITSTSGKTSTTIEIVIDQNDVFQSIALTVENTKELIAELEHAANIVAGEIERQNNG